MSLCIEIRRIDHIIVLEVVGRLELMERGFSPLVEELIGRGERHFIVNLANVSFMDNSGLGRLCMLYTLAKNRGGDMKLLKPTPRIRKILRITRLDTVFQLFESEAEAIRSMPALRTTVSA